MKAINISILKSLMLELEVMAKHLDKELENYQNTNDETLDHAYMNNLNTQFIIDVSKTMGLIAGLKKEADLCQKSLDMLHQYGLFKKSKINELMDILKPPTLKSDIPPPDRGNLN